MSLASFLSRITPSAGTFLAFLAPTSTAEANETWLANFKFGGRLIDYGLHVLVGRRASRWPMAPTIADRLASVLAKVGIVAELHGSIGARVPAAHTARSGHGWDGRVANFHSYS